LLRGQSGKRMPTTSPHTRDSSRGFSVRMPRLIFNNREPAA
jgi:hypothetical protein